MFAGGNLHNDSGALAGYLMTAKESERVELAELRGFAVSGLHDALASIEIQARQTRCRAPFFHGYLRAAPDERLTHEQWFFGIDRLERKLGFTGQPRVVVFHINKRSGEMHPHIAWSRIHTETEKYFALDPGLHIRKSIEVARELEIKFGLSRISSALNPAHKTGPPRRNERKQARRLKTKLRSLRETIRTCWDSSESGAEFQAALEREGLILARGDRRDFVVTDPAGGIHALGKRITGEGMQGIRERLDDIKSGALPTVGEASRQHINLKKTLKRPETNTPIARMAIYPYKGEHFLIDGS